MINTMLVVIAITGFICVSVALTSSHSIYVQVKVLKAEMVSSEDKAKADTLAQLTDHACAFFGIAGAIQVVGALIGFAALRSYRRRDK